MSAVTHERNTEPPATHAWPCCAELRAENYLDDRKWSVKDAHHVLQCEQRAATDNFQHDISAVVLLNLEEALHLQFAFIFFRPPHEFVRPCFAAKRFPLLQQALGVVLHLGDTSRWKDD